MKIRKLNLFSDFHFQTENENWKSPSDFRFPFSNQKRKSELWNSTRTLVPVKHLWIRLVVLEKSKMSHPIRGKDGHLVFPIGPKKNNLVEDIVILLPVKFRCIPFSGLRGEVENVSADQRLGRQSCSSDRPEKHKLGRGCWDLASGQVSLNSVQRFQRRSRKCLSQSEAGWPSCFFFDRHKLGRGHWDLASCQVSLNSFLWFLWFTKMWKVKDDGRRTTHDHNSALEPSSQMQQAFWKYC